MEKNYITNIAKGIPLAKEIPIAKGNIKRTLINCGCI